MCEKRCLHPSVSVFLPATETTEILEFSIIAGRLSLGSGFLILFEMQSRSGGLGSLRKRPTNVSILPYLVCRTAVKCVNQE
jgi:hypothetical protein